MLVAVSDETAAEPEENGEARAAGSICNETGRCVYHVSGRVTFVSPDGSRTVIATGAAADSDSAEYRLEGRKQLFGRGASSAFLGRVSLRETSDGEFLRTVPESDLWWKSDGPGGSWRRYSSEAVKTGLIIGSGRLRYIKNDEVRHSARARILPANADIKYLPSTDPGRGEIVLVGFGRIAATIPPTEGLTVTRRCRGEAYHLELEVDDAVPEDVTVWIDWTGQGRLALELPFPMKRAAFVRPEGDTLPNRARVAVGSLPGVIVEVVVPQETDFELHGIYRGKDAAMLQRPMILRPLPSRTTGHYILDLTLVQGEVWERLELSDDPDGTVKLEVFSNHAHGSLPPTSIIARRFDLQFEWHDDEGSFFVRLDEHSRWHASPETLAVLAVEALALLRPDAEPILLQRCTDDGWQIPQHRMEPGPYLILGREDDWQRARPMLWHVANAAKADSEIDTAPRTVADAYHGHIGGAVDPGRFESVAHELAENYDHPDWPLVFGYLGHRTLPVAAFPLLRAIARVPAASAMAAVRADTRSEFEVLWEQMRSLPFAWWQIPLPCWSDAFASFADSVRGELGTALRLEEISQFLGEVVDRRIDLVRDRLPGLNAALEFMAARVSERAIPNRASRIVQPEMLEFLRQQFLAHRDSCPAHAMKESDIPQLSALTTLVRSLKAQHPWSKSLFEDRTRGFAANIRADFSDAPVVAAMLVVIGAAPLDDLARAIRDIRALNRRWFDEALQLAQLIAFGHQVSDQIDRHL